VIENSGVLAIVGAAVTMTVVLLGIGTAVGYRFGLRAGARLVLTPPPGNAELIKRLQIYRELVQILRERSGAVVESASAHLELLPPTFKRAIDGLVEATKLFGKQLEQGATVAPPGKSRSLAGHARIPSIQPRPRGIEFPHAQPAELPAAVEQQSMNLSGDEIHSLTSLAGNASDKQTDPATCRYPYDCRQTVYPWYERESAWSISAGATVRCRDISLHGIAFFWPDEPDFEQLVISLGSNENPIFMAADVMHSKAVYMHGETCFQVGCRFTGRVPQFNEQARVQLNRLRARQASIAPATTEELASVVE
jgi:hypothetical protein